MGRRGPWEPLNKLKVQITLPVPSALGLCSLVAGEGIRETFQAERSWKLSQVTTTTEGVLGMPGALVFPGGSQTSEACEWPQVTVDLFGNRWGAGRGL